MKRLLIILALTLVMTGLGSAQPASQPPANQISGIVMEARAGTPDVVVILCDAESGMPISAKTHQPFAQKTDHGGPSPDNLMTDLTTALTNDRGRFSFADLPDGHYRMIAQKWIGPFKGVFEVNGSVIQLFGYADVTVPSDEANRVSLTPPGRGVLQLDMDVGNDETLLLLSIAPPQFDPILGFRCLGTPFVRNIVGVNRMPSGRTTIVGLPPAPIHAFYFAPDNVPGCATQTLQPQILGPAEKIPFVAGWSSARHDPPAELQPLMEFLIERSITIEELLDVRGPDGKLDRNALAAIPLDQLVILADGKSYRVGDILAAESYRRLQKSRKKD